jgi:hypothetical protein
MPERLIQLSSTVPVRRMDKKGPGEIVPVKIFSFKLLADWPV